MNSTTGLLIDPRTGGHFFDYISNNDHMTHQVWIDDPTTLSIKYQLANNRQLGGIGMWHVDCLDYSTNASQQVRQDTKDMWDAMKIFKIDQHDLD